MENLHAMTSDYLSMGARDDAWGIRQTAAIMDSRHGAAGDESTDCNGMVTALPVSCFSSPSPFAPILTSFASPLSPKIFCFSVLQVACQRRRDALKAAMMQKMRAQRRHTTRQSSPSYLEAVPWTDANDSWIASSKRDLFLEVEPHAIQYNGKARTHYIIRNSSKSPDRRSFATLRNLLNEANSNHSAIDVNHMFKESIHLTTGSFFHLLQQCIDNNDLIAGQNVHYLITVYGLEKDNFVGSHLIRMYGCFGKLLEAFQVLKTLSEPNVFSWGAIILASVNTSQYELAIRLYHKMQISGMQPDGHIFVAVLKACSEMGDLEKGQQVHTNIIDGGFESELYVGSTLIDMYAKCGCIDKAHLVFDKLPRRNIVAWSVLIAGYSEHGYAKKALDLFDQMQEESLKPNIVTCVWALKACANVAAVVEGRQIHTYIIACGFESNVLVGSSIIGMYADCDDSLADAHRMFNRSHHQDIITWSTLIAGYAEHGYSHEAIKLFEQMQWKGIQADLVTYISALKACSSVGFLKQGRQIHSWIIESNHDLNVCIGSSLINMYMKWGHTDDAGSVFDRLPTQNVVTWSAFISGLGENGYWQEAFCCFEQMKKDGVKPNAITFISMLKACTNSRAGGWGKQIHASLIEVGLELETCVGNALIDMYTKCNSSNYAYRIFEKLEKRDVVTWSALMTACAQQRGCQEAFSCLSRMQHEGIEPNTVTFITILGICSDSAALEHGQHVHADIISRGLSTDVFVGSALIDMYTKCGSLEDAGIVFHQFSKPDSVLWTAMITGYAQHSDYNMAYKFFRNMEAANWKPDDVAFLCILSACSLNHLVEEGCQHFKSMREKYGIMPGCEHYNCIVDLLGSSHYLYEAQDLLESMPFGANIVGWISLLSSCRKHFNLILGRHCFDLIIKQDRGNATAFVLMSNLYALAGRKESVHEIDELRLLANGWKKPGEALIEVDKQVHSFVVGERDHQRSDKIYAKLKALSMQMEMHL